MRAEDSSAFKSGFPSSVQHTHTHMDGRTDRPTGNPQRNSPKLTAKKRAQNITIPWEINAMKQSHWEASNCSPYMETQGSLRHSRQPATGPQTSHQLSCLQQNSPYLDTPHACGLMITGNHAVTDRTCLIYFLLTVKIWMNFS